MPRVQVHAGAALRLPHLLPDKGECEGMPSSAVTQGTGVQVLLNSRILQSADGTMATEAGQDLPADLVYFCTGGAAK